MLHSIRVSNIIPFEDNSVLDFRTIKKFNKDKSEINSLQHISNVLRLNLIYGMSGSGKTTILNLINNFIGYLVMPVNEMVCDKNIIKNPNKPITVELVYDYNAEIFTYTLVFHVKDNIVVFEDLKSNKQKYFTKFRDDELKIYIKDKEQRKQLKMVNNVINNNGNYQPIIKYLCSGNPSFTKKYLPDFVNVRDSLFKLVNSLFFNADDPTYYQKLCNFLMVEENKSKMFSVLHQLDTLIRDIEIVQNTDILEFSLMSNNDIEPGGYVANILQFKTIHNKVVKYDELNNSTKILIKLVYELFFNTDSDALLINDFNFNLHPQILKQLLLGVLTQTNKQVILSTNCTELLKNDIFQLRLDGVYIFNFGYDEENKFHTKIYSVGDFTDVKKNTLIDVWYNSGRFGGVPVTNKINVNEDCKQYINEE